MDSDQVIRLILQLVGKEKAAELAAAIQSIGSAGQQATTGVGKLDTALEESKKEVVQAADAFASYAVTVGEAADFSRSFVATVNTVEAGLELEARAAREAEASLDRLTAEAVEATRAQRLMRAAIADVAPAAAMSAAEIKKLKEAKEAAAKASFALNSRVLELGRGIQDVAQGGIAGGINNIERLVGGAGALAGILTIVGTILFVFKDRIVEVAEKAGLLGEKFGVDGLLGTFEKVEAGLKATTKEMEALRDKQKLTADEMVRYNELSAKQIELEKQKGAELEKQAQIKALEKLKDKGESEAAGKRAEQLQGDVGGQQDQLAKSVAPFLNWESGDKIRGMQKELEKANAEFKRNQDRQVTGAELGESGQLLYDAQMTLIAKREQLTAQISKAVADQEQNAKAVVAKAVIGGDKGAIGQINQAAQINPGAFTPEQRKAFADANSGLNKKADAKAQKESGDADRKASDAEAKAIEKMKADGLAEQVAAGEAIRKSGEVVTGASEKDAAAVKAEIMQQVATAKKVAAEKARFEAGVDKTQADIVEAARKAGLAEAKKRVDEISANTGIDEKAGVAAATARAQGGFTDRFGRFRQATPEQQQAVLAQDAALAAKQRDPSLSPENARGVGEEVSRRAFEQVDDSNDANRQALMDRGLNANEATQQAAMMTLNATQAMLQRVQALEAGADALEAGADALARQTAALNRDGTAVRPTSQRRAPAR